jgi:SAM-dependent methyltransferase
VRSDVVHHRIVAEYSGRVDDSPSIDSVDYDVLVCAFCEGRLTQRHEAREMMHGTRDVFHYGECRSCRSLQLINPPTDLAQYYPLDYYSLRAKPRASYVKRAAKRLRAEAAIRGHARVAIAVGLGAPMPNWVVWLKLTGLDRSASVCDIGCGIGDTLLDLKDQGFADLTGADAFISSSVVREGIPIHQATPDEVPGRYAFVMLNHALEHMPNPPEALEQLKRLLLPGGALMLRVPVAGCFAWREYGVNWVSLDAPRHLHVPSEPGLRELAAKMGFEVAAVVYDSTAAQFWRSEQYRLDLPLFDARSHEIAPRQSIFSRAQIESWDHCAQRLNAVGDGDTAAFFLRLRK